MYLGPDVITTDACSSFSGFNLKFPVTLSNDTETGGLGVEVCMWTPSVNMTEHNNPESRTFLISNRFEEKQNWETQGSFLVPTVTVEDMFNTSMRDMNYTWFTGMFTGTKNETNNMTQWCMKSEMFNNFFAMAQTTSATAFNFYVNVIMNDLAANRSACQTEETLINSVQFCGLSKDLAGCAKNTMPPTLTFTMGGGSDSTSGTNWLLWGGVGAGVVVVVGVVVFMMKGKGGDDDYANAE